MSIHRSGLKGSIYLICTSDLKLEGIVLKAGEKYELVHELGSMYVMKSADGREIVAPKDIFKEEIDK